MNHSTGDVHITVLLNPPTGCKYVTCACRSIKGTKLGIMLALCAAHPQACAAGCPDLLSFPAVEQARGADACPALPGRRMRAICSCKHSRCHAVHWEPVANFRLLRKVAQHGASRAWDKHAQVSTAAAHAQSCSQQQVRTDDLCCDLNCREPSRDCERGRQHRGTRPYA